MYVRYAIAKITSAAVAIAIGRRSGRRSGPRSTNGTATSSTIRIVGTPIVATGVRIAGLITRRSSKRKKKYHSGRGTYVVVVGSAFGPSSAPNMIDMATIVRTVMRHIT